MLLIKTTLKESAINGIGLYADEFIAQGTVIWKWHEGFDQSYSIEEINALPESICTSFIRRAYFSPYLHKYVLCCDDARFMNHSDRPNTRDLGGIDYQAVTIASRNIEPGEEITINYFDYDGDADWKVRDEAILHRVRDNYLSEARFTQLNWVSPKLGKIETGAYGQGLAALQNIYKDEVLIVYGGHVFTLTEYFLLPPELQPYPYQIADDLLYGPTSLTEVGDGELLNHSCHPNAGFRGPIHLVAMRDIVPGEEVTVDYAILMTTDIVTNNMDMGCLCGASQCRKIIRASDWMLPELQERYRGYFQPYIEAKIARMDSG
jgi:hypothetical protein